MPQKPPAIDLIIERLLPHIAAVVFTVGIWLGNHYWLHCTPEKIASLLPSVISVVGVALAFVAAAQAIVLGISERPLVVKLKELGAYKRFHGYFGNAIFWCALALGMSCALVVIDGAPGGLWVTRIFRLVWLYMLLEATFTSLRVTWFFGQVVRHLD